MPQRRIEAYFSVPLHLRSYGTKSFLDLPYNVRRHTYILAGLVRFCPINLNQEGLRDALHETKDASCFYYSRRFHGKYYGVDGVVPCQCPPLPYSLLYTSRFVSREVVFILYSENKFTISRNESWALKPLRNLGMEALRALRSVTIRLNNRSCVYGYRSFPDRNIPPCHTLCEIDGLHDRPMSNQAKQDQAALQGWYNLVRSLAPHISPGLVTLSIICDTENLDTAYQVVAPLSQFPLLRTCSIRLGKHFNLRLYNLARAHTAQLIGQPIDCDPKPYRYHLPQEIIEHTLAYTDLIAPFDLEWIPTKGLVPFDCCKTCVNTLDCCSCSFYHAAYSSTCTCWRLPRALFLTSRSVRRIATVLFYSRNTFVLYPHILYQWCPYQGSTSLQSPLAQFIVALPRNALSHLRHLTLTFPYFELEGFLQNERKMTEWGKAIDLLARTVNLPNLTLILDFDSALYGRYRYPHPYPNSPLQEVERLEPYQRVLQHLFSLRGMGNFFVRLSPRRLACILEKSIMGSDYDAVANGKLQHRRKIWNALYSLERVYGPDGRKIWPRSYLSDETESDTEDEE